MLKIIKFLIIGRRKSILLSSGKFVDAQHLIPGWCQIKEDIAAYKRTPNLKDIVPGLGTKTLLRKTINEIQEAAIFLLLLEFHQILLHRSSLLTSQSKFSPPSVLISSFVVRVLEQHLCSLYALFQDRESLASLWALSSSRQSKAEAMDPNRKIGILKSFLW